MWHKLRRQIAVEREMLRGHLDDFSALVAKCEHAGPDPTELMALGGMLHAFYAGVENAFKRVALELGEDLGAAERWHKSLLLSMTKPGPDRPPVISEDLARDLDAYLGFRHIFRQAYLSQLDWDRMMPLVLGCRGVFERFEAELDRFLEGTGERQ